ncbi:hypothetical protein JCM33374_g1779 [Metschnikowia sp. JCM 33374]|nr:hypothetical protein JCM33374_g1779 [Metschnikowia sp. JCM 33374]
MVHLPDDLEQASQPSTSSSWKQALYQILNAVRIHNIPALNLCIVAVLGVFLAKLTTKYKELYMKNSLVTIIVTNLVLYGISETLAQSILSFRRQAPILSFSFHDPSIANLAAEAGVNTYGDSVSLDTQIGSFSTPLSTSASQQNLLDDDELGSDDSDVDEENLDRFLNYLRSDTSLPYTRESVPGDVAQPYELSYYNFSRLAGFMCWGFVMAFVQCWWYRFLQIYSKHPQFVEVLRKVMSDQFCFSPVSLFCFFTYGTIVLESGTWADAKAKLHKLYLQTLVINYCVWFPVQFINFLLVPRDFQVPFSSSVSVLWNCFLSMRNSTS